MGALAARPWHDEFYTLELARRPVGEILAALHLDSGPPGYYLLCRLLHLAGADSVRALRLLSVAGVVLGVALLVLAVRSTPGRWAAAALLAAHPLLLAASLEARPYGLLFAAAAGAALLLGGRLGGREAVLLGAVLAAACWVHSLGLVLTLAVVVAAVLLERRERVRAWAAVLGALVLHLPWFGVMLRQPPESLEWMASGRAAMPAWQRVLAPVLQPSPVAPRGPFLPLAELPGPLVAAGLAAWLVLLAGGLWGASRPRWVFWTWWAVGGGALVAATALLRPVYAPGRADLILLPAAVVVVASGVGGRFRWDRLLLVGLLLGGLVTCGLTLRSWAAAPPPPAEELAAVLARRAAPGDTVVCTGWWYLGLRQAVGPAEEGLRWRSFPASTLEHPGWYDDALGLAARGEVAGLARELARELAAGHGVWLVRTPALASDRLLEPLVGTLGLEPVAASPGRWVLFGRGGAPAR